MEKSENLGMQTFDAALFKLHAAGKITHEEAMSNADSPNNLRLRIKLSQGDAAPTEKEVKEVVEKAAPTSFGELSLEEIEEPEEDDPNQLKF